MANTKKQIFSAVLSCIMVSGLLPAGAAAAEPDTRVSNQAASVPTAQVAGTPSAYEPAPETGLKLSILSDCHIYDGDTLGKTGAAFDSYLKNDRKMLLESPKLMDEAVRRIQAGDAEYVLVSGDLTKDGEKANHLLMASKLQELEAAGKQVFVINGNHDLSNAGAVSYTGDTATPVDTVDRTEFKEIYADFGYDQAVAQDPASLSYAADLGSDYRLIAMDTCIYNNQTGSTREQATAGLFQDSTLSWVLEQIRAAVLAGRRPIGMMHHGLVPHNAIQSAFFPEYLVQNYEAVSAQLADAGMNLVFTGHFHSQDAALFTSPKGSSLYDIETGALVTYPSPIRTVTLDGSQVAYASQFVTTVAGLGGNDLSDPALSGVFTSDGFDAYSQKYLLEGLKGQVTGMLTSVLVSQGLAQEEALAQAEALAASQPFTPLSSMTVSDFLAACMSLHYAGDENQSPAYSTLSLLTTAILQSDDSTIQLFGNAVWALINDTSGTIANPVMDPVTDNTGRITLPALPHYSSGSGEDPVLPLAAGGQGSIPHGSKTFTQADASYWAADAVSFASTRAAGSAVFRPEEPVSRSMLATVLHRLAGTPATEKHANFSDVSSDAWYAGAVDWASEAGIVRGTGSGFAPERSVTRQELVTVLYRYAQERGMDLTPSAALSSFADAAAVSPFAREAMAWAVGNGILNGTGSGTLDPRGFAGRTQVSAVIERFILTAA